MSRPLSATSKRKSVAIQVPNTLYVQLTDLYVTTHLYSCVMKCINALSLQGNGVFSAYDCHIGTSYPYMDCLIACSYFVELGFLRVVYDAGGHQAMSTFKRTDSVILHEKDQPVKRARKVTSAQEMLSWIDDHFSICFHKND